MTYLLYFAADASAGYVIFNNVPQYCERLQLPAKDQKNKYGDLLLQCLLKKNALLSY